jgi:hypothetical protein
MAEQLARLGISEHEYDMTATAQATASTTMRIPSPVGGKNGR